ncbi:MAG: tRNA 5-methoxyuridine(34)/uridine 5-oxyacetic acid(34) synthase CmoB, partial [Planctomycetota bacterium]
MTDPLEELPGPFDREAVARCRAEALARFEDPRLTERRAAIEACPAIETDHCVIDQPVIEIGRSEEGEPHRAAIDRVLDAFRPWKKGPFRFFGTTIDAEWRSDLKWARIEAAMTPLAGRTVADIGCHNGYFMYRMAAHNPAQVIGFEPVAAHALLFEFLQRYARVPQLAFEMLGVEHLTLFPDCFDTVFCLGILYHHRNPLGLLEGLHRSLRPGGEVIIDCQGVAGDEPHAYFPPGRYARARGVWFLPTRAALENWLVRSRFVDLEWIWA